MSLATELLRQVREAKEKAQDEMGVPSYDNINTPNNHVGNTSNATKERKVSGLGDRKVKNPTANIGSPGKEKRDMEGVKGVTVKESAGDLGLGVQGGLLHFHHPNNPEERYQIEWDQDAQNFLQNVMRKVKDTSQLYDLLMDYYEQGPGHDPRNMTPYRPEDMDIKRGLAASKGDWPLAEDETMFGGNPVATALQMRSAGDGFVYMASPDGKAAMMVPWSGPVRKAVGAYVTSPDARVDTNAAAARLFQLVGQKVPGVKAAQPQEVGASRSMQSGSSGQSKEAPNWELEGDAGAPDMTAAALGGDPYNSRGRMVASVGESAHKAADGEMAHVKVSKPAPAKSASVRGKQNDEPTNKGNPGSSKEEKGVKKPQFSPSVKDFKGGENEHKSMKKMHEAKKSLEQLLGRPLNLKGTGKA